MSLVQAVLQVFTQWMNTHGRTIVSSEVSRKEGLGVDADAEEGCCKKHPNAANPKVQRHAHTLWIFHINDIALRSWEQRRIHIHLVALVKEERSAHQVFEKHNQEDC
jgi:hypothetical protein